jgi:hypothetical protein
MTSETIATLLGGGVLGYMAQALFKFLNSRKAMTLSNEEILRSEMQDQLDVMKAEIKELRGEVNVWKGKYFELYEEHIQLKAMLG